MDSMQAYCYRRSLLCLMHLVAHHIAYLPAKDMCHLRAYLCLNPGIDWTNAPYVGSSCERSSKKQHSCNGAPYAPEIHRASGSDYMAKAKDYISRQAADQCVCCIIHSQGGSNPICSLRARFCQNVAARRSKACS